MDKQRSIQIMDELLSEVNMKAAHFAESIGVSSQVIYDILDPKKKNGISRNLADKTVLRFPQINKYYLLTGEGSINKVQELGENATKQELISAINRITKTVEVVSDAVLKGKEADLINAEANLLREKNNERIANAYVSNSEVLRMLAEYLIRKEK